MSPPPKVFAKTVGCQINCKQKSFENNFKKSQWKLYLIKYKHELAQAAFKGLMQAIYSWLFFNNAG